MQVSYNMISMYQSLDSETYNSATGLSLNTSISSKLEELTTAIHQLLRSSNERSTSNKTALRVRKNLETCIRSARRIIFSVPSGRPPLSSQRGRVVSKGLNAHTIWPNSRMDPLPASREETNPHEFIQTEELILPPAIPEEPEIEGTSANNQLNTPSILEFRSGPESLQDMSETHATASVKTDERTQEPRLRDPSDMSIQFELIQSLRRSAAAKINTKHYAEAEKILSRIHSRSEAKFGRQYEWRSETLSMLAIGYCEVKKWEEAEQLVTEQLKGRDEIIATVAAGLCTRRCVGQGRQELRLCRAAV